MNRIGEYLLVSLGFVIAAMFEFADVILVNRKPTLKKNPEVKIGRKNDALTKMIIKSSTKVQPEWKINTKESSNKIKITVVKTD